MAASAKLFFTLSFTLCRCLELLCSFVHSLSRLHLPNSVVQGPCVADKYNYFYSAGRGAEAKSLRLLCDHRENAGFKTTV